MKVAVTGASGFLGRHVLRVLNSRGDCSVITSSRSVPEDFDAEARSHHVTLDLAAPQGAFEKLGSPDVLLHLAWEGLPNYRSARHLEVEGPRQFEFLQELVQSGLKKLCVTGTCLEYGMQTGELSEDMTPLPDNAYASAKNTLRLRLESLRDSHPFELTWARLFYVYGEGQAPSSLYSQLNKAIASGDDEFPMSPGDQRRDFLPVTEMAQRLVALALDAPGAGIVNVCSGRPVSVQEFVQGMIRAHQASLRLLPGQYPYPDYEPFEFWGSTRKMRSLLNLNAIS